MRAGVRTHTVAQETQELAVVPPYEIETWRTPAVKALGAAHLSPPGSLCSIHLVRSSSSPLLPFGTPRPYLAANPGCTPYLHHPAARTWRTPALQGFIAQGARKEAASCCAHRAGSWCHCAGI